MLLLRKLSLRKQNIRWFSLSFFYKSKRINYRFEFACHARFNRIVSLVLSVSTLNGKVIFAANFSSCRCYFIIMKNSIKPCFEYSLPTHYLPGKWIKLCRHTTEPIWQTPIHKHGSIFIIIHFCFTLACNKWKESSKG